MFYKVPALHQTSALAHLILAHPPFQTYFRFTDEETEAPRRGATSQGQSWDVNQKRDSMLPERLHLANIKLVFIECLLCASCCMKGFQGFSSFNPHKNPMGFKETEAEVPCPGPTDPSDRTRTQSRQ